MMKPQYTNNFQIFVAPNTSGGNGEATIQFNHVYRTSAPAHPVNQDGKTDVNSNVPGGDVVLNTETVAAIVMNRHDLYQLHSSISAIIAQIEVDEKMKKLEG